MLNKKQIAAAARKILRHSKGLKDPKLMHPEREWVIGLCVAVAIFAVTASGSAYTYWQNKHLSAVVPEGTEEVIVYRESMVKEALKRFGDRNAEREALMGTMTGMSAAPSEPAPETEASSTASSTEEAVVEVSASSTEALEP